jgi:hypothetical protein
VSATNVKRVFKSLGNDSKRLVEHIKQIPKKHWQIRKPENKHQWCFLFGTNWSKNNKMGYPEIRQRGFHDIESPKGQNILNQLNYTKEELERQEKSRYPSIPGLEDFLEKQEEE